MNSDRRHRLGAGELVPIADRLRYMLGFRLAVGLAVALLGLLYAERLEVDAGDLLVLSGAYVVLAAIGHAAWHLSRRGGLVLFGATLMIDGVFLAWASVATGGAASPIRYLIIVHLIAVALLASYRTGLKLALWHTLLLLVVFYAQDAEVIAPGRVVEGALGSPFQQLLLFGGVFWFVTVATASFSAVNERELRRRRYDLEALASMAARIEEASDSRMVADAFLEAVVDTFGFERALLAGRRDGEELVALAQRGATAAGVAAPPPGPGSAIERAMESHSTVLRSRLDERTDPWLASLLPGAENVVVLPLATEHRALGVLVVEHAHRAGSRIERRVVSTLERFASQGALALRNTWLLEQVQELAATDPLTGLANRLAFQDALDGELARAARERQDVSLLMIDIDHFKQLNDAYGHQVGDAVLERVGGALDRGSREYDVAARYGGEEFAVVLPNTSTEEACLIAHRLVREIAAEGERRVTASAGLATFPRDGATPDDLVRAADEALYESKRGGRARVTLAGVAALAAAR